MELQKKNSKAEATSASLRAFAAGIQLSSGDLPSAVAFEHYERVHPGAAAKLLAMAENEQKSRHEAIRTTYELRREEVRQISAERKRAQYLAFFLSLIVLATGAFLVLKGYEYAGIAAFCSSALTGVISAFTNRNNDQQLIQIVKRPPPK